ncbi:MAG: hypothetical protein QOE90_457 [Thermoplasmata archaeon]|jgi:predicted RNase H-like HicB family nuclease|nr:hypothetical protein [Thermoplasmata archaeon]
MEHESDSMRAFDVLIEPGEDSGYVARVPALPGCHTQGATLDEVLANIQEAIALYLDVEGSPATRLVGLRGSSDESQGSGLGARDSRFDGEP